MSGRPVLVTGATSGIRAGIARAFAAVGDTVVATGATEAEVEAARADGRIDPEYSEPDWFKETLREAERHPDDRERLPEVYGYLDDPVAALEWTREGFGEPVRNPFKDVGRNDPCPCGSGKKFKNWSWGFRRRYPVPLLGQYSASTVGVVPEGQPLHPAMAQAPPGQVYYYGPPPPGAPGFQQGANGGAPGYPMPPQGYPQQGYPQHNGYYAAPVAKDGVVVGSSPVPGTATPPQAPQPVYQSPTSPPPTTQLPPAPRPNAPSPPLQPT